MSEYFRNVVIVMRSRILPFCCVMALMFSVVVFCNVKILPNFVKVEHELGTVDDTNVLPDYDPKAEMSDEIRQTMENANPDAAVSYNSETGEITVTEIVVDSDSSTTGTEPYNPDGSKVTTLPNEPEATTPPN